MAGEYVRRIQELRRSSAARPRPGQRFDGPDEREWDVDRRSAAFLGLCDGCEHRVVQSVRNVAGEWGTATVCAYHEHHAD